MRIHSAATPAPKSAPKQSQAAKQKPKTTNAYASSNQKHDEQKAPQRTADTPSDVLANAAAETKRDKGVYASMKRAFSPYVENHSHAVLYGIIGFVAAALILIVGFWPTVLLAVFAAIGVVIGHEMTHGFDDQGRNFDKDGNMNNWWTEEDAAAFKAKTDILVKQFDAIEVLPAKDGQPAIMANGSLSLGENIADQGGLRVSHTAFRNSLNGTEPAPIDGFTADQRFYLAYATLWAQNIRDEEIARLTKLDVHSLGKWRVNATLRNLQDFYDAFSMTDGEMFMPEEERVVIW